MTFKVNPKGRNWGSLVNWDDLGKLYAGFAIAWTVILYAGATWLFINRHISFLKMRNIPLAIAAISFLHVYLVKILLAYTTNGHFLCSAEFWIMSIYLPFGIALFQANVVQLQSVSDQQQALLNGEHATNHRRNQRHPSGVKGLISRWRALTALHKTYAMIGLGMLAQLVATAAIYGTSKKLQGFWPANLSHAKGQAFCRKGLEWIPSSIWQLWWSCFYGPYLLYKVRNIKDLHYWRLQIVFSVIAGFPGSPLWLAALYSPAFKPVNIRFVPPMWLAPGIIVAQAVTIFFPIYEAYKSRSQLRTTLELIKSWDEKRHNDDSTLNSSSSSSKHRSYFSTSVKSISTTTRSVRSREMHTMAALEKALIMNPIPLLHFAATKDFTGENIVFLMQVRDWHAAWKRMLSTNNPLPDAAKSALYDMALEIYVSSVHEKSASFPINIESKIKRDLDAVFEAAASDRRPYRDDSTADPFTDRSVHDPFTTPPRPQSIDLPLPRSLRGILERADSDDTEPTLRNGSQDDMGSTKELMFEVNPCVRPPVRRAEAAKLISAFDEHVFDEAEKSIKYLVLTNTWQKFVMEHNAVSP